MDYIFAALVGALLTFLLAFLVERFRAKLLGPRMELSFKPDTACITRTPVLHPLINQTMTQDGTYYRVKLETVGGETARGCMVYLNGVWRETPRGWQNILSDTLPLRRAHLDLLPVVIPRHIRFYYDLFHILHASTDIRFNTIIPSLLIDQTRAPGTYIFQVCASGDNFDPLFCNVRVLRTETGSELSVDQWQEQVPAEI